MNTRQFGFSLIEILIAVFILAVGLLGFAGLQLLSFKTGTEGYARLQATAIAEDLVSKVTVNKAIATNSPVWVEPLPGGPKAAISDYLIRYAANPYQCDSGVQLCKQDEAAASPINCTDEQIIASDMWEACSESKNRLPDGQVHAKAEGVRLSVAVSWDGARGPDGEGEPPESCTQLFPETSGRECVVIDLVP